MNDTLQTLQDIISVDDIRDIIISFVEIINPQIEKIKCAEDLTELRALAHSLKGSASNVGASDLATISAQIEQCARSGQELNVIKELYSALEKTGEETIAEYNMWLQNNQGS